MNEELIPISIISFNRPDYLEKMLLSLINQKRAGKLEYHLFQDFEQFFFRMLENSFL